MNKLKLRKTLIITFAVLELLLLNLTYNSLKNKPVILDDVKLKEITIDKNMFGLYLEDENGEYQKSNLTTWPTDMKFNAEKSACMDVNGEIVPNVLKYENNGISVSAGKTVYCYVYFDISKDLNMILASNSLAMEYRGDGYYHDENDRDTTNPFFTRPIYYWYAENDTDANNIRNSWNVVYAGSCWQIIRTTDQGGVKLLYNGEPDITEVDGETQYDCSDNRNAYHMGEIESEYSISGSKLYGSDFTPSTSGTTTTFTLTDTETVNVTASNASSVVGKYTCGNTSSTCTNLNLRKIVSIKTGTTAIVYTSTGRDNIGRSKFNDKNDSPAYVGYMYNDNTASKSLNPIINYTLADGTTDISLTSTLNSTTLGWYFSDTYLTGTNAYSSCSYTSGTGGQNTCYALEGTPELGSSIVGSNNDYSKLVGKYTMKSNNAAYGTTDSIKSIKYVVGYNGTTLYLLQVEYNHPLSYYQKTYNLSKTYENGTLQSSVQVKNFATPEELAVDNTAWESTWVKVYNTYNNQKYYVCTNGTDTCTPYYITSTNWKSFSYLNPTNTYNFSNAISYNTSTSKYTLEMSDSNAVNVWHFGDSNEFNKIGKAHYVCLDDTSNHQPVVNETECIWVGYAHSVNDSTLYYMPLSNGQYVSTDTTSTIGMTKWADEKNLLYKMLYASDVNSTSSTIKSNIDKWYEARIKNTAAESKIDIKEIYCGDRSISNFGSWNLNANNMTNSLNFYGLGNKYVIINGKSINQYNLSCPNKSDAYSKKASDNGNGALTYAIGLMSNPEMENMNKQTVRKNSYSNWLASPNNFSRYSASEWSVDATGYIGNGSVNSINGVRPAISLIAGTEYKSGKGTFTEPYIID